MRSIGPLTGICELSVTRAASLAKFTLAKRGEISPAASAVPCC